MKNIASIQFVCVRVCVCVCVRACVKHPSHTSDSVTVIASSNIATSIHPIGAIQGQLVGYY